MTDARQRAYLQEVLALDPRDDAAAILERRREYLQPSDIIMAEVAQRDDTDLRTRMQRRLSELRRVFWSLDADTLQRHIAVLKQVANPETSAAAARLSQVAQQRDEVVKLRRNHLSDDRFVDILMKVLIAPTAEANRLREREYRWMRPPADSELYRSARRAIQGTARLMQKQYPGVFALEETWLTELLEYNPEHERKSENTDTALGCGILLMIPATIYLIVKIVGWIF